MDLLGGKRDVTHFNVARAKVVPFGCTDLDAYLEAGLLIPLKLRGRDVKITVYQSYCRCH